MNECEKEVRRCRRSRASAGKPRGLRDQSLRPAIDFRSHHPATTSGNPKIRSKAQAIVLGSTSSREPVQIFGSETNHFASVERPCAGCGTVKARKVGADPSSHAHRAA